MSSQETNPERVHVHVYLEYPVTVNLFTNPPKRAPGPAVMAMMTIGGSIVGTSAPGTVQVTVDETNKKADLMWVDDRGNTDAAAPANAQVAFDSDDPAVATVDATSGQITPVAEGTFNLNASVIDTSTGAQLELNGTPVSVSPAQIQVVAGAAVGAELGIQQVS